MIIHNEKFKQSILTALADKEMVKIIDHATFRAVSVNDVIKQTDIPHTTAYRKINWMLEEGLLTVERINITSEGKKNSLFRSILKSVTVKLDQGKTIVEAEYNVDVKEKVAERFFSLDSIENNKK
jgi:type II secretory pathway component PulF